ncbi:MAG: DNA topoisomerase 3 [Bacteroidales bacterium]
MKVCIAEKPSVAREIARIVGANNKKDGYLEGNGYQITWVFGHLCTLKEPHDYNPVWKRWSLNDLPIIPDRFGIKLITNPGVEKQFKTIEHLIAGAEEVINCGDAGQEGELIQRWVMQKAKCKCPVYRLWISSLTEEAIREGFQHLRPESEFQKLYEAGLSRAIGDWLLGINCTRLYTVKYGKQNLLSIGRVQTPTLALIVNRQLDIENFKPEKYWELKTVYRNTTFSATKGKFATQEEGEQFLEEVKQSPFTVTDVKIKKGDEFPPRLFDLTSLQVECNKKFAFSADDTLQLIQSLYEKKLTTYPRVDTTYLSDDMYPKIPGILRGLKAYELYTQLLLNTPKLPKSKKVFDNSKVTDHHAIIPTGVVANSINDREKKVYDLIARRFIAAFYPNCKISTTTVLGEAKEIPFKVTGKQILDPGWRVVFTKDDNQPDDTDKEKEEEESTLPAFKKGENGEHIPSLLEKQTQPPKPFTEATLLRAMETAGKLVDNDELRDALKENGIGRPSTRAAIIETLFKRNYIRKEKKNLVATDTAIHLMQTIHEELLKSAELTGMWEKKLREIEKGKYDAKSFMEELKQMVQDVVNNEKRPHNKVSQPAPQPIICPKCKEGTILKGKTAFGCSNWKNGCNLRVNFAEYGENLTREQLTDILNKLSKST